MSPQVFPIVIERVHIKVNDHSYRLSKVKLAKTRFIWRVFRWLDDSWNHMTPIPFRRKSDAIDYINDIESVASPAAELEASCQL